MKRPTTKGLAISILILTALAFLMPSIPQAGMKKMQRYTANGQYWATVNHFSNSYNGYQIAGTDRTWQVF